MKIGLRKGDRRAEGGFGNSVKHEIKGHDRVLRRCLNGLYGRCRRRKRRKIVAWATLHAAVLRCLGFGAEIMVGMQLEGGREEACEYHEGQQEFPMLNKRAHTS